MTKTPKKKTTIKEREMPIIVLLTILTDGRFLLEDSRTTVRGGCSHFVQERRRIYVSAKQFVSRLNMIPFISFCWRHEEDLRKVKATRVREGGANAARKDIDAYVTRNANQDLRIKFIA